MTTDLTEIHKMFTEFGIGKYYHNMRLIEFGERGEQFKQYLQDDAWKMRVASGFGYNFYGPHSIDMSIMVLRALALNGFTVQVTSLVKLVNMGRTNDTDLRARLVSRDVILVRTFCGELECPLGQYDKYPIEDLLEDRWEMGKAVFVQSRDKLDKYKGWWGRDTMDQIKTHNEDVECLHGRTTATTTE